MESAFSGSDTNLSTDDGEKGDFELQLFKCRDAYVYQVPPAGTLGHRAELWNVNQWLSQVHVTVIRNAHDDALVQLHSADADNPELFAECPVQLPLQTCVEPVIDSSRYFVLRVVDKHSGRHAFIGLGFRDRSEASDFNATLMEHQQYMERKAAAAAMRKAYDEHAAAKVGGGGSGSGADATEKSGDGGDGETAGEDSGAAAAAAAAAAMDLSLQPGKKLNLALNVGRGSSGGSFLTHQPRGKLAKTFSLMFDPDNTGGAVAALAPPPALRRESPMMGLSPMGVSPSHRDTAAWGDFESAEEKKE